MDGLLTTQQILDIFAKAVDKREEKQLEIAKLMVDEYSTREDAAQPDAFLEFIRMLMVIYMKAGAEAMVRILQNRHMLCTKCVAPAEDT